MYNSHTLIGDLLIMQQEQTIYKARQHWIVFIFPLLIIAIGAYIYFQQPMFRDPGLLILAIGAGFIIVSLLTYWAKVIIVTNNRVIIKSGIIFRRSAEMVMDKIEMVNVLQSIVGKLLGFGTLTVIGTGGTRESFKSLNRPHRCRSVIEQSGSADG